MKQSFFLYIILSFLLSTVSYAQAPDCGSALSSPFCSGIAQYPANFDGTGSGSGPQAPSGPNYDCLGTQGNPSYFSLTIEQNGNIDFTLDNSANIDIDFILWGPFNSINAAQIACDSMGNGGIWGDVADCSYLTNSQEQVTITNAVAGETYILMVTNYANVATNIFSTNNTGNGSIACPCEIPFNIDTTTVSSINDGFLVDTTNGTNRFVVCANNQLAFQLGASGNANDTLSLYGAFTNINSVFPTNTIVTVPTPVDTLSVITLITPDDSHIGTNTFSIGLQNKINTGGLVDSSCYDRLDIEVIVPGVRLSNRTVCSGESFQVLTDSIPTTSLGSSTYSWSQLSGPTVSFSSTTDRQPTITIPTTASTNSNDSIVIEVDYSYGGLCPSKDTMVLYFNTVSIDATAMPATVCPGVSTNLMVSLSDTLTPPVCDDYAVAAIPFAPVSGSGTSLTLSDDQVSNPLLIGFDFDFYCNTYDSFYISSNGFITFDGNAFSANSAEQIPNNAPFGVNNLIAMCWTDNNPADGGTIEYFTTGTAPNRRLIVNFINVPLFLSAGPQTVQAILHETTNIVELHITSAVSNGSGITIGMENATGTIGHAIPNGNFVVDTFNNVAYSFTPVTTGPFYNWTPAASLSATDVVNPVATPVTTTTYTVTLDEGICRYVDTIRVDVVPSNLAVNLDSSDSTCAGANNGSLTVSPTGGTPNYTYNWSNNATTASITGLAADNYTVTITDNSGCIVIDSFTVNNLPPFTINLDSTQSTCAGSNTGALTVSVTGGAPTFTYNWNNNATGANITGLAANTYNVTVTDNNGCTATDNFIVNTAPNVSASITANTANLSCDLLPIGALTGTATGGTTITYNWSNNATTTSITGLDAGTYSVTATNEFGCTGSASFTINAPVVPTLNAYVSAPGITDTIIPESTTTTVYAGNTNFDYNWTAIAPTGGDANIDNNTAASTLVSPDIEGTYSYIVTASATTNDTICTATDTVFITVEAPFQGIPNAFTPTSNPSDNLNNTFRPVMLSDNIVQVFRVYNRWGQEVYNGDEAHGDGWDGTFQGVAQPSDVYIYVIVYQRPSDAEPVTVRGEVTLIR